MTVSDNIIKDLRTAIMSVSTLLTQEQFIVKDKVVDAMIEAINFLEEQKEKKCEIVEECCENCINAKETDIDGLIDCKKDGRSKDCDMVCDEYKHK